MKRNYIRTPLSSLSGPLSPSLSTHSLSLSFSLYPPLSFLSPLSPLSFPIISTLLCHLGGDWDLAPFIGFLQRSLLWILVHPVNNDGPNRLSSMCERGEREGVCVSARGEERVGWREWKGEWQGIVGGGRREGGQVARMNDTLVMLVKQGMGRLSMVEMKDRK